MDGLKRAEDDLRCKVAELSDESLDKSLAAGGSSAYNNLHGYLQHVLYHAVQIAIMRKAIEASRTSE